VNLFVESRNRAVSPVVATILMVAVVVIIAASIGAVSLGFGSELREPERIRFMGDTDVSLGVEYRDWSRGGGNETHGDIDHITIQYDHGPTFEGDDIGSVRVQWENASGQQGELTFLNPNKFSSQTGQQFHEGNVGEFSTGDFAAGDQITIRMVHNRYQGNNGKTGQNRVGGIQYVESWGNDIALSGNKPFFRTENRYPIQFRGERPINAGDEVTVTFFGPEQAEIVGETRATASKYEGTARKIDRSDLDS